MIFRLEDDNTCVFMTVRFRRMQEAEMNATLQDILGWFLHLYMYLQYISLEFIHIM